MADSTNAWKMAEVSKMRLTRSALREVRRIYKNTADYVEEQLRNIPDNSFLVSDSMKHAYYSGHLRRINEQIDRTTAELQQTLPKFTRRAAALATSATIKVMHGEGLRMTGELSYVPDRVVKRLVTGRVYGGNWNFSRALWRHGEKTKQDLQTIVAQGIADNRSIISIARDLEKYVNPSARKPWNWKKVYPTISMEVDYNAARLARTLVQHAYQVALVESVYDNPFVTDIRWNIANNHRVCPICRDREGRLYKKHELPLDHPNGACYFTPVLNGTAETRASRLAKWAKGETEDPQLDRMYEQWKRERVPQDKSKLYRPPKK